MKTPVSESLFYEVARVRFTALLKKRHRNRRFNNFFIGHIRALLKEVLKR